MLKNKSVFARIEMLFIIGFGVAGLLAILKTIFVSIDIDESYAISQAFRLVQGDKLLIDMWEPHQLSAYPTAFLLKLFVTITGSTDYSVIFLRVCGTFIHLLLAFALYRVIKPWTTSQISLFITFLHVNYLAKWIQTPEFEIMQYWLLISTAICLITYFQKGRGNGFLVLAGISMMLQLLNYPTMILLYPFYMMGIFRIAVVKHYKRQAFVITTLSALFSGLCVLFLLFYRQTLDELIENIGYILADPSHTEKSFCLRMREFLVEIGNDMLLLLLVTAGAMFLVFIYHKLSHKELISRKKCLIQVGLLASVLLCLASMFGCLFGNQNQFFLQERYLYIAILGFFVYMSQRENKLIPQLLYWFMLIPSVISVIASAGLTNMTLNVSYSRFFAGCIATFLLIITCYDKEEQRQIVFPVSFVVMSLLVCKLILIRVTGCLPVTIHAKLQQVQNGPLKGVFVLEDYARIYEEDLLLLNKYVSASDNLLIFGCESLLYVGCDAQISAASVQGTSVFDEVFLEYFRLHPNKYPTIIAVDKRFEMVDAYHYHWKNYIVADWIETEFSYLQKIETDDMILYIQ